MSCPAAGPAPEPGPCGPPDLGDIVVALLANTLEDLRDRLAEDGYIHAAELVADLSDIADAYRATRRHASER